MNTRFRRSLLAATALLLVGTAACGGKGDSSRSDPTPQMNDATSQINVDEAEHAVAALSMPPDIGYNPGPLKSRPVGKKIAVILPTTARSAANEPVWERLGKELGFNLWIRQVGTSAEDMADVMNEVADDSSIVGVYVNSRDPSLWQSQFDKISARGTPIVLSSITDDPKWTSKSVNIQSADRVVKNISGYAADWMVADSGGKGSSVVFTIPVQPALDKVADAYSSRIEESCPGCSVDRVNIKGFDSIGKDLPGSVVSYLQAHPNVKYVFMAFGDMTIGVPDALRAIGMSDVKLYSQSAGRTNIQYLRDGLQAADFAYSNQLLIYVGLDALARGTQGESMEVADKWMMPAQLLTPENVSSAKVNQDGSLDVADTEAFFINLWGIE